MIDGFGRPIDRKAHIRPAGCDYRALPGAPQPHGSRTHCRAGIETGIRAIDAIMPCGKGQRMGLFGGSGVGKSTLLGSMARHNSADVTVIALIGERNREVRAFLEHDLGPDGSKRLGGGLCHWIGLGLLPCACEHASSYLAIAEYFRDQGSECPADYGFRNSAGHGAA